MIKIVKGTYGYKEKNGTITPKTEKDKPFVLTDEQEARLVGRGVAVYVKNEEVAPVQPEEVVLEELPYNELKKIAKEMGLEQGTKEELVERIREAQEENAEDDEQEPPPLKAEMPE
ncbi:MAG: SAP domain-containing protein [Lachnospiraceae bacterium]|nr:SAP domain-containing protein [Lachnospiraceae bacterium]